LPKYSKKVARFELGGELGILDVLDALGFGADLGDDGPRGEGEVVDADIFGDDVGPSVPGDGPDGGQPEPSGIGDGSGGLGSRDRIPEPEPLPAPLLAADVLQAVDVALPLPPLPPPPPVGPLADADIAAPVGGGRGGGGIRARGRGGGRGWRGRRGVDEYESVSVPLRTDPTGPAAGKIVINEHPLSQSLDVHCSRCHCRINRKFEPHAARPYLPQGRPMASHLMFLQFPCHGVESDHRAMYSDDMMPHEHRVEIRAWGMSLGTLEAAFKAERPEGPQDENGEPRIVP